MTLGMSRRDEAYAGRWEWDGREGLSMGEIREALLGRSRSGVQSEARGDSSTSLDANTLNTFNIMYTMLCVRIPRAEPQFRGCPRRHGTARLSQRIGCLFNRRHITKTPREDVLFPVSITSLSSESYNNKNTANNLHRS